MTVWSTLCYSVCMAVCMCVTLHLVLCSAFDALFTPRIFFYFVCIVNHDTMLNLNCFFSQNILSYVGKCSAIFLQKVKNQYIM